ncbi:alpha-1,3-arabinosyltransferase XAT3-like [Typha latifolia]|uniref:alpha-1,3-arabinosyltransferase XAT3-like n=1 Tax=Typha latifolia TaxID=4733 RepID=UPI003C2C505D
MKSQRKFPRPEPRKLGNVLIIASMLLSLCLLSLIKALYCSTPYGKSDGPLKLELERQKSLKMVTNNTSQSAVQTEISNVVDFSKPICFESSRKSNTCDAQGDIRVEGITQTIFVHPMQQEWKIRPYARKHDQAALDSVKEWTLRPFSGGGPPPRCTTSHSVPALVFSNAGFTGNLFHDYTDVLIPLFISSYQFHGEVQFLVSGLKSWWVDKFILFLKQLSKYEIIDIDADREIRCFPRVVVGPAFHKQLGVDPSKTPTRYSILDFKRVLKDAYGLKRSIVAPRRRPRLLIISRKGTRKFMNEGAIAEMATKLGFDVRIGEADMNTDMATFARMVNSIDVMIGVHGAGLTNMVFLPLGAVVIQVVPYGGLDWLAKETFRAPAKEMGIKYMEYKIQVDETTLSEQYKGSHPVLKNPHSIQKQGWDTIKTVYLDKQNVRPHLGRLKNTLMQALKLLPQRQN